jgi:hypothetical protein
VLGVCSRDSETIESRFPTLLGNKTNNGGNVARNSPQEFSSVVQYIPKAEESRFTSAGEYIS